ncbi:MAG: response regulator transcription factor [Candidatus Paceibacterota bacterium]
MSSVDSTPKILVVDDEEAVRIAVCTALRSSGMLCSEAADAGRARKVITKSRPDLVILDLTLPDQDGLQLLKELRTFDDLPVLVLSGRSEEEDKVKGLDYGADDYITKPFSRTELISRVKSVLRRSKGSAYGVKITFGDIQIDTSAREVKKNGDTIQLTAREYELLLFLAKHPRTVFSREDLIKKVWPNSTDRGLATVTEHVRRLRNKIELDPENPVHLRAVRGVGYRLVL